MKTVLSGVVASCLLAGCGGIANIKPPAPPDKAASVRLESVEAAPLAVGAATRAAAQKAAPAAPHQLKPQEAQSEAHHRIPNSIANDPPPKPPPEYPPLEPGKAPLEARTFNFFPFKLRRKARKRVRLD